MLQKKLNIEFQEDFTRSRYLQGIFSFLMFFALFEEVRLGHIMWSFPVIAVALGFSLKLYAKSIKDLLYTYWTLSVVFILYVLFSLFQAQYHFGANTLVFIYLLSLVLLFMQMYVLSSPVYYPRVKWWEYDFRYRHDLKVSAVCEGINVEARLTDLRRGAGCVVSFEEFNVGNTIKVKHISQDQMFIAEAKIVSKREYTMGRGITYGVKFNISNSDERKVLSEFSDLWKREQRKKSLMKLHT